MEKYLNGQSISLIYKGYKVKQIINNDVIVSIGNISNFVFNYRVLIPFGLGIICSFYFVVKFISICLNKHKKKLLK